LREFYEKQHPPLHGYLLRRAGVSTADDLAQDTWIDFFRGQGLRHPEPVGLLFTIGHRRFTDWVRRQVRSSFTSLAPDDLDQYVGSLPSWKFCHPEIEIEAIERRRLLLQEVNQLPVRQRQAVLLTYFDDFDQQETARIMGITVNGVKALLKAALAKLRGSEVLAQLRPVRRYAGES
jgi:RNA polymerase sigma-70 factor (ECF subfamily)